MLRVLNLVGAPDSHCAKVIRNNGDPAQIQIAFDGSNAFAALIDPDKLLRVGRSSLLTLMVLSRETTY